MPMRSTSPRSQEPRYRDETVAIAPARAVGKETRIGSPEASSGSSAIDQATTPSPVVIDADGDARPQGAQKDIGADEYVAN
jgi:hypothetical protein